MLGLIDSIETPDRLQDGAVSEDATRMLRQKDE
jgi:hypothetical protein